MIKKGYVIKRKTRCEYLLTIMQICESSEFVFHENLFWEIPWFLNHLNAIIKRIWPHSDINRVKLIPASAAHNKQQKNLGEFLVFLAIWNLK